MNHAMVVVEGGLLKLGGGGERGGGGLIVYPAWNDIAFQSVRCKVLSSEYTDKEVC